jgi:hypothetical protein
MKKKAIVILVLLVSKLTIGQSGPDNQPPSRMRSSIEKYIHFLEKDSIRNNTLILASYNFMFTNQGAITHGGRGTYVGLGINAARLFTKKIVLGFNVELKAWKGLWPSKLTSTYLNDFNENYQNQLTVKEDSTRAAVLKECMNGSDRYTRRGTFYSAIGISFSPFPQKYGGFMLIAKMPGFGIPVHGTFGTLFNPEGTDWVSISVPCKYSFELVFKPLTFFKRTASDFVCRLFQCSLFYERLSWKDAKFDGLPFSSFMSPSFIRKYSMQEHYGFTIKIGLY